MAFEMPENLYLYLFFLFFFLSFFFILSQVL